MFQSLSHFFLRSEFPILLVGQICLLKCYLKLRWYIEAKLYCLIDYDFWPRGNIDESTSLLAIQSKNKDPISSLINPFAHRPLHLAQGLRTPARRRSPKLTAESLRVELENFIQKWQYNYHFDSMAFHKFSYKILFFYWMLNSRVMEGQKENAGKVQIVLNEQQRAVALSSPS